MTTTRIGILSDTHLDTVSDHFKTVVASCFADVSMILHAGDLTSLAVLEAFNDKEIHAVHGNMCTHKTCKALPTHKTIEVGGFTIGLVHRVGNSYDFEDRLIELFPEADCIVYGHTHHPVCHQIGTTLYMNPGSFFSTGRYGAPPTYGILEINGKSLSGSIHQVGR